MTTTNKTNGTKNGIDLRFGKGRKLAVMSYAVWVNGVEQVSHLTTTSLRKSGTDLSNLVELERKNNPELPIL